MIPDKIFNDIIEEIAGVDVISLVDLIKGKSHVSEFKIADKLEITVNQVRNMLYKLSAYNLVDSARKKDKKKGWYVYYWTLDLIKLRDLAIKRKSDRIRLLKERVKKELVGEFFACPDRHIRMNLENAMEHNFRCPECDLSLEREDNQKVINLLKKQTEKLTRDVEVLGELVIKPVVERKLIRKPKEEKPAVKKKVVKPKKKVVKKVAKKTKKKSLKNKIVKKLKKVVKKKVVKKKVVKKKTIKRKTTKKKKR